jgi:hypothetical protein
MYQTFIDRNSKQIKNQPTYWLFIDEWYSLLPMIEEHENGKLVLRKFNRLVQMGLEFNMRVVLITQSHLCTDFGFNSQARNAFRFLALARQSITETIDSAVNDRYLIPDGTKRKRLQEAFQQIDKNSEAPIACAPHLTVVKNLPDFKWLEKHQLDLSGFRIKGSPELDNRDEDNCKLDLDINLDIDVEVNSGFESNHEPDNEIDLLDHLFSCKPNPVSPVCSAIINYMERRKITKISARDLARASLSGLAGLSVPEIQEFLVQLETLEYGSVQDDRSFVLLN